MANKITESYWRAWLNWHVYRRRAADPWLKERYATMWTFRQFAERCQPGGLMVDCGANVGDASMMLLRRGFTVHAFEPDPIASAELERCLGGNPQLTIHRQAVGAFARVATFHTSPSYDVGETIFSSIFERPERHGRTTEVEIVDLFDFLHSLDRRVDLLKLDIEGAEFEILERMLTDGTAHDVGLVFAEMHSDIPGAKQHIAHIRDQIASQKITNIHLGWA